MYKPKPCKKCGAIMQLYQCEECYGADDINEETTEKHSDNFSNKCSTDKKNKFLITSLKELFREIRRH